MTDKFGSILSGAVEIRDVDKKEERKMEVLTFLEQHRLAFTRKVLWRNMAYHGCSFKEGAIKNYLPELRDHGLVERIDANEYAEQNLVKADGDPGYWIITKRGVQVAENYVSNSESDIDDSHL